MPTQGQAKRRSAIQPADKPAKRTRVSRACDQCRVAREKCDGLQPTCSTCSVSKRRCSYTANPKKRGIQPGYIRTLELALAWLFQDSPKNETLLNDKLAQEGASSLFLSRDSKESNRLHRRWRKARFYTDVDKLLSGGEPSRHEQSDPLSPQSDDEDSEAEETITGDTSQLQPQNEGPSRPSVQQPIPSSQHSAGDNAILSMPPNSWGLFETYFTYTQCWLPICEKHDILKLYYSYPAEGLSPDSVQANSGAHAELWSVLTVASLHANSMSSFSQSDPSFKTSEQMYNIARSLIPGELCNLDFGHVRALLNLAVFNITQSLPEAAWVLVGYASRILERVNQSQLLEKPRGKHVLSGCFLLDSMLALQLERRPYVQYYDLERLGKIYEDGLEEWQPWSRDPHISLQEPPRVPSLALSTFSNLLDIINILVSNEQPTFSLTCSHDIHNRLQSWKASLPSRLNYLHSETTSTPFTPPAVLLQITYYCTALVARPSEPWLGRLLDFMKHCQERLGLICLPPTVNCLIAFISRRIARLSFDESARVHLQILQADLKNAWPARLASRKEVHDSSTVHSMPSNASVQTPAPDLLQSIIVATQSNNLPVAANDPYVTPIASTQPAVTDQQHTNITSNQSFGSLFTPNRPGHADPRFPDSTDDLESFFDELASLDNAPRLDNQPQFMQNLGFLPDANMADLFSEYIPMQSSAFLSREDTGTAGFDQYKFYDAS
ncbi:Nn.00g088330.m01.CDS01 [Neocucurbitaria sp. VM-36]